MSIKICKNFILDNIYYNAATPIASTYHQLRKLENSNLGAICTKSCTLRPIYKKSIANNVFEFDEKTKTSYNCYGLVNPGFEYYHQYRQRKVKNLHYKPYVISFYPTSLNDLIVLSRMNLEGIDSLEINISCPNYNTQNKMDAINLKDYFPSIPIGLKVALHTTSQSHTKSCSQIKKLNPDYIVCGNTLGCGISPNGMKGAIGGKPLKSIGLWNVSQYKQNLNIPIIGCGGIETLKDVQDYIEHGASACQIGTSMYVNPNKWLKCNL